MTLSDLGTPLVIRGELGAREVCSQRIPFPIQFSRDRVLKLKGITLAAVVGLFIGAIWASLRTPDGSATPAVEIVNAASIRGNYVARRSMPNNTGSDDDAEISLLKARNRRLEALVTVLQKRGQRATVGKSGVLYGDRIAKSRQMKTRAAAAVLFAAGSLLAGKAAWNLLTYASFQSHPDWFTSPDEGRPRPFEARLFRDPVLRPASDKTSRLRILGRIVIPRVGLSVLVVEGDDEASLSVAAGHLPGTASFGGEGNSVIAGHRDLTFRPLKDVTLGDYVTVFALKTYNYTVDRIRIVEPDDISVLDGGRDPVLTLLTCYPFRYAGSAPQRFVVRCRLL